MRGALILIAVLSATTSPASVDSPRAYATLRYRSDALVIRLSPGASRRALDVERARGAASGLEPLGVPALDRLARDLGGIRFEREFPGESPPVPGAIEALAGTAPVDFTAFFIAHLPPGADPEHARAAIEAAPGVESAERIAIVPVAAIPNDSLWSRAWQFHQASRRDIHAPEAWDLTTGDTSVVVAILDTGVLLDHPELAGQLWTNWVERTGVAGADDDGNGYVDDDRGWDFVSLSSAAEAVRGEDWQDADNEPSDFVAHGTAVAGLVAAASDNGIGVAGTAWRARLMPLRVGWSSARAPSGEIDQSYVAKAIRYATRMGAKVANCSFTSFQQGDLIAAVDEAVRSGVTVVVSGGNGQPMHYLASREDVVAVTATDADDKVASFATRGRFVDLAAPGVGLPTTSLARTDVDGAVVRQPAYTGNATGTSFSAPLVAGAVALLQAERRARGLADASPIEVLLKLNETADDLAPRNPSGTGYGSGRLNLLRLLTEPARSAAIPTGGSRTVRTVGPGVVLTPPGEPARMVFAMSDARLVVAEAARPDSARSIALTAPPQGGLAAASLDRCSPAACFVALADGNLAGFDPEGRVLSGWPVRATLNLSGAPTEPSLGDLDGDGRLEVVWPACESWGSRLLAWRSDGSPFTPVGRLLDRGVVRIALSDLDGDPGAEIVVTMNRMVTVMRHDGREISGWPRTLPASGDPLDPLVLRLGSRIAVVVAVHDQLLAFDARGATIWQRTLGSPQSVAPAAGDFDGDGVDEIVVTTSDHVAVLDTLGLERGGWTVRFGGASGATLIGGVSPAGGLGVFSYDSNGDVHVFDGEGSRVAGFPKPIGARPSPSIADLDGDGGTEVVAGAAGGWILRYDVGPGTWSDPARGWPTARGGYARTGSRLYAPSFTAPDLGTPAAVTAFAAAPIDAGRIELTWTLPAGARSDDRYELRASPAPIDATNFAAALLVVSIPGNVGPGSVLRTQVEGLLEGRSYHFAIRGESCAGPGPIAAIPAATSIVSPGPVRDLQVVECGNTSATLSWTATGDDGSVGMPARYVVHAAEFPLDSTTLDSATIRVSVPATRSAGGIEQVTLGGLACGRRYWVALRAFDEVGAASAPSAVATFETTLPGKVTDLAVVGFGAGWVHLAWTAPSHVESGTRYEVRHSITPLDDQSFGRGTLAATIAGAGGPGGPEHAAVSGLVEGRAYWFAVRIQGCAGAVPISNGVEVALPLAAPARIEDLRVFPAGDSAVVRWTATGEDGRIGRPLRYLVRFEDRAFDPQSFDPAAPRLEHPATAPAGAPESLVVRSLERGRRYWIAVWAEDGAGNLSPSSNVVTAYRPRTHDREGVVLLAGTTLGAPPIELFWQSGGPGAGERREIGLYDVAGRAVRRFPIDASDGGTVVWDGRDDAGRRVRPGLYFARLAIGGQEARARIVLIP